MIEIINELPPLPSSVSEIEKMYANPDASFEDIEKVINKDSFLTAEILKKANSPFFGFSRRIISVKQAVSLFGKNNVRSMVLSTILSKTLKFNLSPYEMTEKDFMETTMLQNAVAVKWSMKERDKLNDKFSVAAFIFEIGKMLISKKILETKEEFSFKQKIDDKEYTSQNIIDDEKKEIGFSTVEITAMILDNWMFDLDIVDIIKNIDEPQKAKEDNRYPSSVLKVIRSLVVLNGKITKKSVEEARFILKEEGLSEEVFNSIINSLEDE